MILSAQAIRRLSLPMSYPNAPGSRPLITPFVERTVHVPSGTSYGLGPCTYDLRIALDQDRVLQPGQFMLAVTIERFCMPYDLCATCMDKSTLARRGLAVQNTHMDPGWEGYLTLELSNHGPQGIQLQHGQPIAQVRFDLLDQATAQPYGGKYQNQPPVPVEAIAEKVP